MGQSPQRNLNVTNFLLGLVEKLLCPSQWRHTAFCENPEEPSLLLYSCLCFPCPYTSEEGRYRNEQIQLFCHFLGQSAFSVRFFSE